MKKILFILIPALFALIPAQAQKVGNRDFNLSVVDRKGKLMTKNDIYLVIPEDTDEIFSLKGSGHAVLEELPYGDTIRVVMGKTMYVIPTGDFDELQLVAKNKSTLSGYMRNGKVVETRFSTEPRNPFNAGFKEVDDLDMYSNLASYIEGRFAGVQVVEVNGRKEILIRGKRTIGTGAFSNLDVAEKDGALSNPTPLPIITNEAALIVVDGMPAFDFDSVNNSILPSDVKSIVIDKDGSSWGARGANGVVMITTKLGGQ